ncbi:MAG: S41 family peptidase [Candidatus Gastranaerophilaceae bacterium]
MKKKQFIIFILLVLALFIFNKILMGDFVTNSTITNTQELVNKEHVNSQTLFNRTWKIVKKNFYDSSLNGQDWSRWESHYRGKIKNDDDANVAIGTMLESLDDPYSRYLDKKNYAEQNTSIDSKITGIGVNISSLGGKTYVVSVIESTPAFFAGLKSGDIILKVNGKEISGMKASEVADLVRGPENTVVKITVLRKKGLITKKIIRKEIKIKTVKSSIDKNIGYIQVLSFIGNTTSSEFIDALEKTNNTKGLIIDLRGNTGGLLPNAVFIANMFINKGTLVSIVGRNGYKKDIYAQETEYVVDKPMLVLVDGASASASEILSGALKDYHKATLIGTKTFGKGMVQKIIPMPNETGLNLTIAKYLTPAGHDINKKGIAPDIEVKLTEKDIFNRNDVQLRKAKMVLAKMIEEEKN